MLMRNRILLGILVALCTLALVTPASAVTINGVEYTILAKSKILMEGSDDCPHILNPPGVPPPGKVCMNIIGNVAVSDGNNPADQNDGRLQIGSNNDIRGEVIADEILFGTGSQSDSCEFNTSVPVPTVGPNGNCLTAPVPFPGTPNLVAWPPLGAVQIPVGCNPATAPNLTVPAGGNLSPVPGCYRDALVNAGGTLNLAAGTYTFRNLTSKAGANILGAGSTSTTVIVQSLTNTDAGSTTSGVTIESPGTAAQSVKEFIIIGSGSILADVLLYVPTAAIHLHLGTTGTNVEAVANFITVEPVILVTQIVTTFCACFDDFTQNGNTVAITTGHGFSKPGVKFFVSPSCDPGAGVQVTATITSDSAATLNIAAAAPTAGKHLIVQSSAGTFCSTQLLQ